MIENRLSNNVPETVQPPFFLGCLRYPRVFFDLESGSIVRIFSDGHGAWEDSEGTTLWGERSGQLLQMGFFNPEIVGVYLPEKDLSKLPIDSVQFIIFWGGLQTMGHLGCKPHVTSHLGHSVNNHLLTPNGLGWNSTHWASPPKKKQTCREIMEEIIFEELNYKGLSWSG